MSRHVKKRRWTAEEDARMFAEYPDTRSATLAASMGRSVDAVRTRAIQLGIRKTHEALSRIQSESYTPGNRGSFYKGFEPWNKGKAGEYNVSHGAPLGTERVRDGYLQRKVSDAGPFWRRWVAVHVLVWENHHGPVPPGHMVAFVDGNRQNIDINNLKLITQAENLERQGVHTFGPELYRLMQLRGQITRQLNKRKRRHEQQPEHD